MRKELTPQLKDYELIDSGDFEKLERFGQYVTRRPEPQAIWRKSLPEQEWRRRADASFLREERSEERGEWKFKPHVPSRWVVGFDYRGMSLKMRLAFTSFKHVGIFPEQAANWEFIYDRCEALRAKGTTPKVLNLFAYTGGATVACTYAGATVCHVDAAKNMVERAKENMRLSGLENKPVRYIVDDCKKFVQREIRRGKKYDAIIMDPPSYGRGPNGEMWKLENELYSLVELCKEVLSDNPLFFLINSYTTGLQPQVIKNILKLILPEGKIDADEIGVETDEGIVLPCGCSGFWTR